MTKNNCEYLEYLVKNNPNDQILGSKIQELGANKMKDGYIWELFYKKTRGNAQKIGERFRSILNNNGIFSNIISLLD